MLDLTVIVPTIRIAKLDGLYKSFVESFHGTWEMILVSPYELTAWVRHHPNTRWIQDWGTPIRCQQRGLVEAQGKYITRAVDDSLYLPNAMNEACKLLDDDYKTVIAMKYTESNSTIDRKHKDFQNMLDPKFYTLVYHNQTLKPYVPAHYLLLNFGIVTTELLREIGGWDCQFETPALGELDLAIRLQMHGAKFILTDDIVLQCDWMPGTDGDHAPMHYGFDEDNKLYAKIYSDPACEDRIVIPLDNWKQSPERWLRRFGR